MNINNFGRTSFVHTTGLKERIEKMDKAEKMIAEMRADLEIVDTLLDTWKAENKSLKYAIKFEKEICRKEQATNKRLEAELERLEKRDLNASIVLCFNDGKDPFAREELKVVDVSVSDNIYVVESAEFAKLQADLEKQRKGKTNE